MNPATITRPRRVPALFAALALSLAAALAPDGASAQVTRPWTPPGDSLMRDVTTARMRFMRQRGDSVGGDNYSAFDDVGRLARKLLRSLGREHFIQAPALEATLDSLGFDTEVSVDPAQPHVVLVLVRNPFKVSSDAVGYLFWHVRDDLRMQGASFPPARDVRLRTWYTGRPGAPYEACVLFTGKGEKPRPSLKLFRLSSDGRFWNLVQHEGNAPDFGAGAKVAFVDANLDGQPEIVSFHAVQDDSFFTIRAGVPPIVNEFLYTERPEGFVLHDARTVPGPLEALRMFAMHLASPEPARARRLLRDPAKVDEAIANGWAKLRGRDAWIVEYGEADQPWPEWVAVRTNDAGGPRRWIFRFYIEDDRWVIRDWRPVQPAAPPLPPPGAAPADSARGRRP